MAMLWVLMAGVASSVGASAPPTSMFQLAGYRLLNSSAGVQRHAEPRALRPPSADGDDMLQALLALRKQGKLLVSASPEQKRPGGIVPVPLQLPRRLRWAATAINESRPLEALLPAGMPLKGAPAAAKLPRESVAGRRLQGPTKRPCSNHSACTTNEYCMNCEKCLEFHNSLDRDEQKRWTCEPCDLEGGSHCESGRYCSIAKDSVDGQCPSFTGCTSHSNCPVNEYCFDCSLCQKYVSETGRRDIWECQPCPTSLGGFCGISSWCGIKQDGIDGQCPQQHGCASHEECWNSQYCESCAQCQAFLEALPQSQQGHWSCAPCPTAGGGFCEELMFCQVANDGIDGTCPEHRGCNSHAQCLPYEYCMDCGKCALFHDSLTDEKKKKWSCEPCPTRRGGACAPRQFCTVGEDSIEGACPEFAGCGAHTDCGKSEFCLSWEACTQELDYMLCGAKPEMGGLCLRGDLCKHGRSIDGYCPQPPACAAHKDCTKGHFCAAWADCAQREPAVCGPQPMHRDGICLPLEHCVRGLHAPMDGSCPAEQRVGGTLVIREGLKLNGSMQLAIHHQALNVWPVTGPQPLHRPLLRAVIEDYPGWPPKALADVENHANQTGFGYTNNMHLAHPRGEVIVGVVTNSSGEFLRVYLKLDGLPAYSHGRVQVHTGMSCFSRWTVGPPFWNVAGPRSNPWEDASWSANTKGEIHSEVELYTGYEFQQHSGRAVVILASDDTRIGCGVLAEEQVVVQLHDYGNESKEQKNRHNDLEYVGIYNVASGQLHREHLRNLSCPAVEVAIPNKGGIFVEARVHLTEFEMTMLHQECSCVRGENGRDNVCPRGVEYLTPTTASDAENNYLRRVVSKLYPVLFVDEGGLAQPNQLTLYSLTEHVSVPAMLIDSTLGGGEGQASLGCPRLQDPKASIDELPTITELQKAGKVLPDGHVTNKWCVVRLGTPEVDKVVGQGCSVTAKYKFCVVGGARGVIFMADAGDSKDQTLEIFVKEGEQLSNMVPVLFMPYEHHLFESLSGGQQTTISVGPSVGVDLPENFEISDGGLRVYDTASSQWYEHSGLFGTQEWMEFSPVRNVLFVCTSQHEILAFDTSNHRAQMPEFIRSQGSPLPKCHTAPLFRDYHTADVRQGDSFFTVLVDPGQGDDGSGNRLHFFDTTDLSSWKHLSEVHANWEHEENGLGQVVATPDGKRLIITWHCSTLYCGGAGQGHGERLYILDLENIASGTPPPLLGIIDLTMSEGSFVRDVSCDSTNICLASLTWDGVIAVDLSDGPNRHHIIAQHSATFKGPDVPDHISFVRMASGAQKVIASQSRAGRFYVERWSVDMDRFMTGARLGDVLRFDSIWVLDLEGYTRPVNPLPVADPAVHATLTLSISMEDLLASVRGGKVDDVERMVTVALQQALNIDGQRLVVTGTKSSADRSSVDVSFHIVDGNGASPVTLYNMLLQQLETEGSAIRTGLIAPYTPGAQLTAVGIPGDSSSKVIHHVSSGDARQVPAQGNSDSHLLVMLIVTGLCVVITVWAVAFAWRARRTAALATVRANAIARQNPPGPVGLMMQAHAEAPSQGYVIGRPDALGTGDAGATHMATAAAAIGPANSAYVVGTPVAPGSAAAGAEGAVAGTTLSQMDTEKLAAEGSAGSQSAVAEQAAVAAAVPADGAAEAKDSEAEEDSDEQEEAGEENEAAQSGHTHA